MQANWFKLSVAKITTEKPNRVHLTGFGNAVGLFHQFRDELLAEFKLEHKYYSAAQKFLESVRTNEDERFVGIHARRKDYVRYLAGQNYRTKLVGVDFFERALNKLNLTNFAAVLISDDDVWLRRNMMNVAERTILGAGARDFLAKSDDPDALSRRELLSLDLALLWACDHSVYDYGTFGFWGAYLARGKIVTSINVSNRTLTDEEKNLIGGNLTNIEFINAFEDDMS